MERKFHADQEIETVAPPHKRGHISRIAYGHVYLVFFRDGTHDWLPDWEIRPVPEQLSLDD